MASISEILQRHEALGELPTQRPDDLFRLVSTVEPAASNQEIETAWGNEPPPELVELWLHSRRARLFADEEYGQWGMVLLSPTESVERSRREKSERSEQFRDDDIVIAEFLGDSDLLVLAPSEPGVRRLLVALPIDPRSEWYAVGPTLLGLLTRFFEAHGEKFWEVNRETSS